MNCDDIKENITLYIDNELEADEMILIKNHIEHCDSCKKEYEEYKKLIDILHNLTDEEPPKGYCKRLHEKLLKTKLQEKSSFRFKLMKYGSIAAAFVLVISAVYVASLGNGLRGGMSKNQNYDMAPAEAPSTAEESKSESYAGNENNKIAEITADDNRSADFQIMAQAKVADTREMKIIKAGSIITQTESYDLFIKDLIAKVEFLGGYIEQNDTNVRNVYGDRELKYGNIKIRVPQDKFYEFVTFLEENSKINQKNITETDVTKEYYDKDNQIKNLEIQENQLRELFGKAQTVQDMLQIENELRRIRTEIDSLNMSLSDIDDRASMSTVTIEVNEVLKANLTLSYRGSVWERARDGFINTVNGIVEFLENILVWIVSLAPLLIPALIIIIIILFVRKRRLKK